MKISYAAIPEGLRAALETEHGSAYLLGPDLSIRYVNQAWQRFAEENGAPELASSWASAGPIGRFIAPPLRELFEARLSRVLKRGEPWVNVYECSSPTRYRKFNMRVEATAQWPGLVVVHSPLVEATLPHDGSTLDERAALFIDSRGLIVVCSCCGRVRRAENTACWDWAPGLIDPGTPKVSHGICTTCDFQHYGDDAS